MEQSIEAVAKNLKKIRDSRNLSLDQLSEITGVSKSMLRQIENGKSSPTISTTWKIANGLKISFATLLKMPTVHAVVKPFKKGAPLPVESNNYRVYPLVTFEPLHSLETYYLEIDPGTSFSAEPHNGDVYEYLYVTKGTLQILLGDKSFDVKENEFIEFKADQPHQYRCISEGMTTAITQISYL